MTANAMCERFCLTPDANRLIISPMKAMTLREFSIKGGRARMARLTAEERRKLGKLAAEARWGKTPARRRRKQ